MSALAFYREQANTLYGKKTNKELVAIIKQMKPDATALSGLTKASLLNYIAVELECGDDAGKTLQAVPEINQEKECEDCGCVFDHKGWENMKYCEQCDEERWEEEQEDEKKMEEWKKEHEPEREDDDDEEEPEEESVQSEEEPKEEPVQPNEWIQKATESMKYGPDWIVADYAQALEEIANLKAKLQEYKDAGVEITYHKGKPQASISLSKIDEEKEKIHCAIETAKDIAGIKPKPAKKVKAQAKAQAGQPKYKRVDNYQQQYMVDGMTVEMFGNRFELDDGFMRLQYDASGNGWFRKYDGKDQWFNTLNEATKWVRKQKGITNGPNAWCVFKGLTKNVGKVSIERADLDEKWNTYEW